MEVTEEEISGPPYLVVALIVGGLVAVLLVIVLVKWRDMRQPPSYEVPTIQMAELVRG